MTYRRRSRIEDGHDQEDFQAVKLGAGCMMTSVSIGADNHMMGSHFDRPVYRATVFFFLDNINSVPF
jgi:hypothetical protein